MFGYKDSFIYKLKTSFYITLSRYSRHQRDATFKSPGQHQCARRHPRAPSSSHTQDMEAEMWAEIDEETWAMAAGAEAEGERSARLPVRVAIADV